MRSWRVAERHQADRVNHAGVLLDRFERGHGKWRRVCLVRQRVRMGGAELPVATRLLEEAVTARCEGIGIADGRFEVNARELDHVVLFELGWPKHRSGVQAQMPDSVRRNQPNRAFVSFEVKLNGRNTETAHVKVGARRRADYQRPFFVCWQR